MKNSPASWVPANFHYLFGLLPDLFAVISSCIDIRVKPGIYMVCSYRYQRFPETMLRSSLQ